MNQIRGQPPTAPVAEQHAIVNDRLTADSGLPMAKAATLGKNAGLSGLEFGLAIPGIAAHPANGWLLSWVLSRLSAQACISICCARPMTSVQCCQSSRLGMPVVPAFSLSLMPCM